MRSRPAQHARSLTSTKQELKYRSLLSVIARGKPDTRLSLSQRSAYTSPRGNTTRALGAERLGALRARPCGHPRAPRGCAQVFDCGGVPCRSNDVSSSRVNRSPGHCGWWRQKGRRFPQRKVRSVTAISDFARPGLTPFQPGRFPASSPFHGPRRWADRKTEVSTGVGGALPSDSGFSMSGTYASRRSR